MWVISLCVTFIHPAHDLVKILTVEGSGKGTLEGRGGGGGRKRETETETEREGERLREREKRGERKREKGRGGRERGLFSLCGCSGDKLKVGETISRISYHLCRKY